MSVFYRACGLVEVQKYKWQHGKEVFVCGLNKVVHLTPTLADMLDILATWLFVKHIKIS